VTNVSKFLLSSAKFFINNVKFLFQKISNPRSSFCYFVNKQKHAFKIVLFLQSQRQKKATQVIIQGNGRKLTLNCFTAWPEPDRKEFIKIISTRCLLISLITNRYDFDQPFRSGKFISKHINLT
jgi:hypothetical protein